MSEVRWYTSLEAARQVAVAEKRPLYVEFSAVWCGPCQDMQHGTYRDPEVRKLLLIELVLVRVRLEGLLLELSECLGFLDEGAGFQFSKLGQFSHSFYFFKGQAPGGRLHHLQRFPGPRYSYYSRTCLDFWWVRIFLLTL